MNERIRELAEQADNLADKELQMPGEYHPDWHEVRDKKFVQLIVRECCQYLNKEAERLYALSASEHRPNFQEDFEICAEKCLDNIQGLKDHFRIKE